MLKRKPDRTELAQAGCEVIEQAARFVHVSNRVDVNERLMPREKKQEGINNNERGNNAD